MILKKFNLFFVISLFISSMFFVVEAFSQTKRVSSSSSSSKKTSSNLSTARKASSSKSSATKKTTSSSARKVSSSSAKKTTTSKTSSVRKASTSASTKRASTTSKTSTKRAATGNNTSSVRKNSSIRSGSTTSPTQKKVNLSQEASAQKVDESKCREAFVSCMDAQINDLIDKYTYLYDDDAVQALLDTGEPFRCLYYDANNNGIPQNMQVDTNCRAILNESTVASFNISQTDINTAIKEQFSMYIESATCSAGVAKLNAKTSSPNGICNTCNTYKSLNNFLDANTSFNSLWKNYQALCRDKAIVDANVNISELSQTSQTYRDFVNDNCIARDVNDLYFSYNYYCDLRTTTLKSSIGLKTNYCALASEDDNTEGLTGEAKVRAEIANVFATTSSSEYYKEALSRLESGELKMVNFTESNLYKERIEGLGLETLQSFDISTLLNTSTKCDEGYKYNASVGACQLYDKEIGDFVDAGLAVAEFLSLKSGECPLSTDIYDESSKKCIRCSANYEWNSLIRRCQLTTKKTNSEGKTILVQAQEEEEKDARSIYTDLGINRDSSLFSINVVPPLGSGMVFPSVLFRQASNYCFNGKTKSTTGLSTSEHQIVSNFNANKNILAECKSTYKNDLERYYLSGFWPKEDVAPKEDGSYNLQTDYEETDFNSAKNSCNTYEQALISVRDNSYANFDTQIKNYLDDALATIIKNKIKDLTTIANAANALKEDDNQRELDKLQAQTDRELAKAEAALQQQQQEQEALEQQIAYEKEQMNNLNKLKENILNAYGTSMVNACGELISYNYKNWPKSSGSASLLQSINESIIKVNSTGTILTPVTTESFIKGEYDTVASDEYPEFACAELGDLSTSPAFASVQADLEQTFTSGGTEIPLSGGKGTLSAGVYRVSLSGGGGGWGEGISCGVNKCGGGKGAKGYTNSGTFVVLSNTSYTYTVGSAGKDLGTRGECRGGKRMKTGETGGTSTFKANGIIEISAKGGEGGTGAKDTALACESGSSASGSGTGAEPNTNGYVKLYKL